MTTFLSDKPTSGIIGKLGTGEYVYTDNNGMFVLQDGSLVTGTVTTTPDYAGGDVLKVSQGRVTGMVSQGAGSQIGTYSGGASTGGANAQGSYGNVGIGGATGGTVSTPSSSDCPCKITTTPFNMYLSKEQTPNSVPVHGTKKKVVCEETPDGQPNVPCDELKMALKQMDTPTTNDERNPTHKLSGIATDVIADITGRPVASALELAAAVGVGMYVDKKFNLPMWATVGAGLLAAFAAGKITDNLGV